LFQATECQKGPIYSTPRDYPSLQKSEVGVEYHNTRHRAVSLRQHGFLVDTRSLSAPCLLVRDWSSQIPWFIF